MTGCITPKGHTGIEQRRGADRRKMPIGEERQHGIDGPGRSGFDRRISPAIGEFAIADRARLIEENRKLRQALTNLARGIEVCAENRTITAFEISQTETFRLARAALTPAPEGKP